MQLTRHAEKRSKQRGISGEIRHLIMDYGRVSPAPGGVEKIFFGNREYARLVGELKRVIQLLDHAKGGTILLNHDRIITVYKHNS